MSVYLNFSFVLIRTPNLHLRLSTAVVGHGVRGTLGSGQKKLGARI